METHINWIKCSDEQPKESRFYLTVNKCGNIAYLPFSVRHESWNAYDFMDEPSYSLTDSVTHWAVPNFPEGVKGCIEA